MYLFDEKEFIKKFQLKKVTKKQIWNLRVNMVPMIIFKNDQKLYVSKETSNFQKMLVDIYKMYEHECNICKKMSALPTKENGCDKTHDQFLPFPYNRGLRDSKDFSSDSPYISRETLLEKLKDSCRIEKYPEIKLGISICTKRTQRLLVLDCCHFVEYDFHR